MDRAKQKEIASKGGKAAHAKGTAHEFDSSEAREAGRKGGVAVSRNREHMAAIGRRGGEARGHSRSRASVHANTGATDALNGSYQNTRARLQRGADRQVAIDNQNEGVSANPQGNRGGNCVAGRRAPSECTIDTNNNPTARRELRKPLETTKLGQIARCRVTERTKDADRDDANHVLCLRRSHVRRRGAAFERRCA